MTDTVGRLWSQYNPENDINIALTQKAHLSVQHVKFS